MEMFVVMALIVLLFGAQKLPELARASGQAIGEFSRGREEIEAEITETGTRTADDVVVDAPEGA